MNSMNFNMERIVESIFDDIDEMILYEKKNNVTTVTTSNKLQPYHIAVNPINTSIDPLDTSLNSAIYTDDTCTCTPLSNYSNTYTPLSNISTCTSGTSLSVSNNSLNDNNYNYPYIESSNFKMNINDNNDNNIISIFEPLLNSKLQLKSHVFISRDSTQKLAQYIVTESWGHTCSLLYKYLDYIFRCQLFGKQIILIKDPYAYHSKTPKYLIFNTGLQRKHDTEVLYALFTPNNIINAQKWRVPFGHIKHSFLSAQELINKLKKNNIKISPQHFPKRTKFYSCLSQTLYDSSYSLVTNWEERLTTNKDRIFKVIGSAAFFDDNCKFLKLTELVDSFALALPKTCNVAELNPRLAVPQAFVDTKHGKYRLELLLPIIIQFPKYNGNNYKFVLAIGKCEENNKRYVIKSVLTMDMAYANARLVGYVDSLWLHYGYNKKSKNNINDFCVNP